MTQWNREELEFMLQFSHPEKNLADLPGMEESEQHTAILSRIFAIPPEFYRAQRQAFADAAWQAAKNLLGEATFSERVDHLPFNNGERIVGLGDSITDDYQSWIEILRCVYPKMP